MKPQTPLKQGKERQINEKNICKVRNYTSVRGKERNKKEREEHLKNGKTKKQRLKKLMTTPSSFHKGCQTKINRDNPQLPPLSFSSPLVMEVLFSHL